MQFVKARLIPYAPRSGMENMAVDEYMMSWHLNTGIPVFRVYAWSPPTISLGRYQQIDCIDLGACRADGVDVVRRVTGGSAIYHDRELTYCLACACNNLEKKSLTIQESFEIVNRFLIVFYRWMGLNAVYAKDSASTGHPDRRAAFCFSSNEKYDIMINGKKIGGNAQCRLGKAVLQHGSIPLSIDRDRVGRYFKSGMDGANFTSLNEITGIEADTDIHVRLLAESFSETTGLRMYEEDIRPDEKPEIESIMKKKYLSRQWNLEGRAEDDEVFTSRMAR